MDLLNKIEIYSAMPYGGEDNNLDEYFHVARNQVGEHIEAVWDLESIFRPDIPDDDKPAPLMGLESHFEEIRLHYALNYTSWKYHEDLLIWALRALKPNGKLQIVAPDIDWILKYWLADALFADTNQYGESSELGELRIENEQLKKQLGQSDPKKKKSILSRMLKDADIPENALPELSRESIIVAVPDKVLADIPVDWDFDLWLMQQLYSSGAGEPQDTFKALFGKRYLSTLLRRTQFVITLLQNNPNNPKQIEAKAYKHPSRLISDFGGVQDEGDSISGNQPDTQVSE